MAPPELYKMSNPNMSPVQAASPFAGVPMLGQTRTPNPNQSMVPQVQIPGQSLSEGFMSGYEPEALNLPGVGGSGSGFDWKGAMEGFSLGAEGVMGLANAYNAYKQMGLMEDQFDFARADRNQNVANQAAITNERLYQQRAAEARQKGMKDSSAEFANYVDQGTKVSGAAV